MDLEGYWETAAEIIKPQGHIFSITGSSKPLNLDMLKMKSISFSWELMYTRSIFSTDDMDKQHLILNEIAELLDSGNIKNNFNDNFGGIYFGHP